MLTFKHFFLLNFHCLTYSDCLISFVSINALRKWHSTNFRFERMTLLLQDVSKHLWSFFIHFLLSNDWNWHYFYQKLDVWKIRSMWHWKWKYIFTKIDTGYGLCDISYQDWQHCRLNICNKKYIGWIDKYCICQFNECNLKYWDGSAVCIKHQGWTLFPKKSHNPTNIVQHCFHIFFCAIRAQGAKQKCGNQSLDIYAWIM